MKLTPYEKREVRIQAKAIFEEIKKRVEQDKGKLLPAKSAFPLPFSLSIDFIDSERVYGQAWYDPKFGRGCVELSSAYTYAQSPEDLEDTIRHEIAHVFTDAIYGDVKNAKG